MFKSLQATIFCFAAVILAIILISSSFSGNKKTQEMAQQLQTLQEQNNALTADNEKTQKELEATKAEAKLLSEQVKEEIDRNQKNQKNLETAARLNASQKEQIEIAKKQIADLQNKLLVAKQLASNAANGPDAKKLQQELKDAKDELEKVKTDRDNKDIQLKVLFPRVRKLADELLAAKKQLESKNASKGSSQSKTK